MNPRHSGRIINITSIAGMDDLGADGHAL